MTETERSTGHRRFPFRALSKPHDVPIFTEADTHRYLRTPHVYKLRVKDSYCNVGLGERALQCFVRGPTRHRHGSGPGGAFRDAMVANCGRHRIQSAAILGCTRSGRHRHRDRGFLPRKSCRVCLFAGAAYFNTLERDPTIGKRQSARNDSATRSAPLPMVGCFPSLEPVGLRFRHCHQRLSLRAEPKSGKCFTRIAKCSHYRQQKLDCNGISSQSLYSATMHCHSGFSFVASYLCSIADQVKVPSFFPFNLHSLPVISFTGDSQTARVHPLHVRNASTCRPMFQSLLIFVLSFNCRSGGISHGLRMHAPNGVVRLGACRQPVRLQSRVSDKGRGEDYVR